MKHPLVAGIVCGTLLLCGCQSTNWMARNKSTPDKTYAKAENVREEPWTWRKKKSPESKSELPPEFAQKLEDAQRRSASPKSADEWVAEGSEQEVARNFSAAKKAYDEAIRIDPTNVTAQHRLGILADMRKEYVVAQDHYEAALRQKPQDANLLSDLGYSHHLRGNVQQSKRYLLQALDIDRQHKQALKNLGTLYASQGWYEDAALAFRHYRSEAEAQQLLSQYFPNRSSTPGNDIALAGAERVPPPMPKTQEWDAHDLRGMTKDEIIALMERERQAALNERERKALAEMRPNLQPKITPGPWASDPSPPATPANSPSPQSGQTPAWAQEEAATNAPSNAPLTDNSFASQSPQSPSENASPPATHAAAQPEIPFWSGAGVQHRPSMPQTGPDASAYGNPWRDDGGFSSGGAAAPHGPPQGTTIADASRMTAQSVSRQAYQLGMSAGPGTMFPNVAAHSADGNVPTAISEHPAQSDDPWSQSTGPGGYSEMRPSATNAPGNPNDDGQWQNAPTQLPPRSPTDNWNSPTSVPWPGNSTIQPTSGVVPDSRRAAETMPVITPAHSPWGNSSAETPRSGDSFPRPAANAVRNVETSPTSVPSWFDARPNDVPAAARPRGASENTTSVPQWPYTPR